MKTIKIHKIQKERNFSLPISPMSSSEATFVFLVSLVATTIILNNIVLILSYLFNIKGFVLFQLIETIPTNVGYIIIFAISKIFNVE